MDVVRNRDAVHQDDPARTELKDKLGDPALVSQVPCDDVSIFFIATVARIQSAFANPLCEMPGIAVPDEALHPRGLP